MSRGSRAFCGWSKLGRLVKASFINEYSNYKSVKGGFYQNKFPICKNTQKPIAADMKNVGLLKANKVKTLKIVQETIAGAMLPFNSTILPIIK
ncbi:hypothetical protein [Aurantivibrio infirmus]